MMGLSRIMHVWQKLRPPPIPSAYTLNPRFERAFRYELRRAVVDCHPMMAVEWGCDAGFSTSIIASALHSAGARLMVYDLFDWWSPTQVAMNLQLVGVDTTNISFTRKNIWYWLAEIESTSEYWAIEFMYVDACISESLIHDIHARFKDRLRNGMVILFEGSKRLKRLRVPHEHLITIGPGLGKLLP